MTQIETDNKENTNKEESKLELPDNGKTYMAKSKFKLNLHAYIGLTVKGISRLVRVWTQTIVPPAVNTLLYLVVFGSIIGARIGNAQEYSEFIIPGLLMMVVINGSYLNNAFESFMLKFIRTKEELFISPISMHTFVWSFISVAAVRSIASIIVILVVALIFSSFKITYPIIAITMVILTVIVFGLLGLINGIFAKNFEHLNFVPTFVLLPLTFLSGVFYSIDQLSPFFQTVSLFNPLVYIIDSMRYAFLGESGINVWISITFLSVMAIVLYVITLKLINTFMKR